MPPKERVRCPPLLDHVLAANAAYAESFGDKAELALPPAARLRDPDLHGRPLDPAKYAGLTEGDAHVIRNAGGRASDDAIRSLVISYKLLGTGRVVRHPPHRLRDGVLHRRGDPRPAGQQPRDRGARTRTASTTSARAPARPRAPTIDWLTIADQTGSVRDDVARIRNHPLVPSRIPIYGYVYDVQTGRLIEVPEATKVGRATESVAG